MSLSNQAFVWHHSCFVVLYIWINMKMFEYIFIDFVHLYLFYYSNCYNIIEIFIIFRNNSVTNFEIIPGIVFHFEICFENELFHPNIWILEYCSTEQIHLYRKSNLNMKVKRHQQMQNSKKNWSFHLFHFLKWIENFLSQVHFMSDQNGISIRCGAN